MRHVRPSELLVPEHKLWLPEPPRLFIPGLTPAPKLIGAQREISPGSVSWTSPGIYNWSVPLFNNLYIAVLGAGGGGSGAGYTSDYRTPPLESGTLYTGGAGGTGGYSQFDNGYINMYAYGGTGGPGGSTYQTNSPMSTGAAGQGYGGNVSNQYGAGAGGGVYGYTYCHWQSFTGRVWEDRYGYSYGGAGGPGGRCDGHYVFGQIPINTVARIIVQSGGAGGWQATNSGGAYPTAGNGSGVYVSWN